MEKVCFPYPPISIRSWTDISFNLVLRECSPHDDIAIDDDGIGAEGSDTGSHDNCNSDNDVVVDSL